MQSGHYLGRKMSVINLINMYNSSKKKLGSLLCAGDSWFMRESCFLWLWGLKVHCESLDLCLSQANGLESIPWICSHLPSIWAGLCGDSWQIYSLLFTSILPWSSLNLQVLGSRSVELYFCFLLVHTGKSGVFCSGLLVIIDTLWQVGQLGLGFRFYLRSSILFSWRAEMGCWIIYFLFWTSPLLLSLAGIKRIVTSWLLKGLFKEGCSVLPLVETYSHSRACYYCFRAVTLKLCRSAQYPAVINSEMWMMTKIQFTNHKGKKKWLK